MGMRVYLDTCSLQRPLDDKSQLRIRLEAEAVLSVLDLVEANLVQLVSSDALTFEIGRNPHLTRQEFAWEAIAGAPSYVRLSETVEQRARELSQAGIETLDSLHLASAEAGEVDFFCTCDDSFLVKAKRAVRGRTKVVSPLELAEEIEKWQSQQDR
jgi:predicted nucleic acid-binding protein